MIYTSLSVQNNHAFLFEFSLHLEVIKCTHLSNLHRYVALRGTKENSELSHYNRYKNTGLYLVHDLPCETIH